MTQKAKSDDDSRAVLAALVDAARRAARDAAERVSERFARLFGAVHALVVVELDPVAGRLFILAADGATATEVARLAGDQVAPLVSPASEFAAAALNRVPRATAEHALRAGRVQVIIDLAAGSATCVCVPVGAGFNEGVALAALSPEVTFN